MGPGAGLGTRVPAAAGSHPRLREGLSRGLAPLEAARETDLGEFSRWADAERIVLNLHRVYADHASRDLDLMTAFGDAIAWLGHPMHTHV